MNIAAPREVVGRQNSIVSDPGSFQERLSRSSSWGGGRLSQDRADEYCRPTGAPARARTPCGRPARGSLLGTCLVVSSLHPLRGWSLQLSRGGSHVKSVLIALILADEKHGPVPWALCPVSRAARQARRSGGVEHDLSCDDPMYPARQRKSDTAPSVLVESADGQTAPGRRRPCSSGTIGASLSQTRWSGPVVHGDRNAGDDLFDLLSLQHTCPLQEPFRGYTSHLQKVSGGLGVQAVSFARRNPQLVDRTLEIGSPRCERNNDANGRCLECGRTDHGDRTVAL